MITPGPVCLYGLLQPSHSIITPSQLHRPDLWLVRIANGVSGKQKAWAWAIIAERPIGFNQAKTKQLELVGKCYTQGRASSVGRFKWWVVAQSSHVQHYDVVRGECYTEAHAKDHMVHMIKELMP